MEEGKARWANGDGKFERKPNRQIRVRTSEDGKYVMVDDITTWILPTNYVAKIVENARGNGAKKASSKRKGTGTKMGG